MFDRKNATPASSIQIHQRGLRKTSKRAEGYTSVADADPRVTQNDP
jgi:hypothetical protein